jgi:hypothetical protein
MVETLELQSSREKEKDKAETQSALSFVEKV